MKIIILSILAAFITTSSYADVIDKHGRENDRREDWRDDRRDDHRDYRYDDRYDRRDDRYGDHRDDRCDDREHDHRGDRHGGRHGHDNGWGNGHGNGWGYGFPFGGQLVTCESIGGRPNFCHTGMRAVRSIQVYRQYSNAPCIPGRTYRVQGNAVLVTLGCRATFVVNGF